ncbi:MAG: glycosyltransferase family 39 protein [Bacillota bacterium]
MRKLKGYLLSHKLEIVWVTMLLGGFIYFLYGNTRESIWLDESVSIAYANRSYKDILQLITYDSHPPLYYLFMRIFRVLFGDSIFVYRTLSALGTTALAALGIGPVRRACGAKAGFVFSFLVIITPASLIYSQEIRMYTWAAFFVAGSCIYGYLSAAVDEKKDWAKFALFSLAAAYTHFYALLSVVIINVLVFIWVILLRKKEKIKIHLQAALFMTFLYTPAIIHLVRLIIDGETISWIPKVTRKVIENTLSYPLEYKFLFPESVNNYNTFKYIMVFVFLGVLIALIKRKASVRLIILSLSVYSLTLLVEVLASYSIQPLLIPRYMIPCLGLLLLAVAYAISQVPKYVLPLVFVLLLYLISPKIQFIEQNRFNGPMNEVVTFFDNKLNEDDIFIHTDSLTAGPFSYYFKDNRHLWYRLEYSKCKTKILYNGSPYTNVLIGFDLKTFSKGHRNVWLVSHSKDNEIYKLLINSGELKLTDYSRDFSLPNSWFAVSIHKVELNH